MVKITGHESVLKYYSVWKLNDIIVIRPISGRNQPAKRCRQAAACYSYYKSKKNQSIIGGVGIYGEQKDKSMI